MFGDQDIVQRRKAREAADQLYNEALTRLDQALPALPDFPHPPLGYDEHQITPINERWPIVGDPPAVGPSWWRRKLAAFVWELVKPALVRQESFNAALVDHLNRNVAVHRSSRDAVAATLGTLRAELEKLEAFHARLILYLQTITLYVDTKDRSEHVAVLVNVLESGLRALGDEVTRRWDTSAARAADLQRGWEAMQARDRRQAAAVDELRTNLALVQQTGAMLKRELERLLATDWHAARPGGGAAPDAPVAPPATASPSSSAATAAALTDQVNAFKYVGFENKFRGDEAEIRTRQMEYLSIFAGTSDVLDLGCGRGEFLGLLREHGISGRGLDVNHEMVEICRARGLTVDEGDALAFLQSLPDGALGGLVALQVVEHFPPPYLLRFLDVAFQKLRPGAPLLLETLNPASWFAFFEAYIRDVTHAWPLHPDTLKYLVTVSGFQQVDVRFSSPYPANAKLQHCTAPAGAQGLAMRNLVQVLNENVDKVNALMFGYLDYAVIARRG